MASPAPSDSSTSSTSSSSSGSASDGSIHLSQAPPSPLPVFAPRPVRLPQSYFRLQRPFTFAGGNDDGLATNWRRTTPSPAHREEMNGRRRAGSVSSLSSTNSALAGTRLESVNEGFDGDSDAGDEYKLYSPSLNRDILEELRTITRLPRGSIDRTESPGYPPVSRVSNIPTTDSSNADTSVRLPLRTPPIADGHRRMLSDVSGRGGSPTDGWKRALPSPISRQIMRNPILYNESFDQD